MPMRFYFKIFAFLVTLTIVCTLVNHIYLSFFFYEINRSEYIKHVFGFSGYIKKHSKYLNSIFVDIESTYSENFNHSNCNIYNGNSFQSVYSNYPRLLPLHQNKSINFKCLKQKINSASKPKKIILIYDDLIKSKYLSRDEFDGKETCPITNCVITKNRTVLAQSDLVLFNLNNLSAKLKSLKRNARQIWTYFSYEPFDQINNPNLQNLDKIFNWSSTYRSDSTFFSFHYRRLNLHWLKTASQNEEALTKIVKKKSIATIINNCDQYLDHLVYINELKKYVDVDVFGKCGDMSCQSLSSSSSSSSFKTSSREFMNFFLYFKTDSNEIADQEKCLKDISKIYKYFFAFEDFVCENYISESFFNVVKYDLVPIVFKSFDHEQYVPKTAFINANSFKTAKGLADYITFLNSNEKDYLRYFNWKRYVEFQQNQQTLSAYHSIFCDMCIKLHLIDIDKKENKELIQEDPLKYDIAKSCYRLRAKKALSFVYSDGFYENDFWKNLADIILH